MKLQSEILYTDAEMLRLLVLLLIIVYFTSDKYMNFWELGAKSYGLNFYIYPKSRILCGLKMTYNRSIFNFELVNLLGL